MIFPFRTITNPATKTTYLHKADVAAFLVELAATEPTDTRKRLEEAARNILSLKRQPDEATA